MRAFLRSAQRERMAARGQARERELAGREAAVRISARELTLSSREAELERRERNVEARKQELASVRESEQALERE